MYTEKSHSLLPLPTCSLLSAKCNHLLVCCLSFWCFFTENQINVKYIPPPPLLERRQHAIYPVLNDGLCTCRSILEISWWPHTEIVLLNNHTRFHCAAVLQVNQPAPMKDSWVVSRLLLLHKQWITLCVSHRVCV